MENNLLHIYGQGQWHGDAFLVGTQESLTKLRDAIDQALAKGSSDCVSFAADGEGYTTNVIRVNYVPKFKELKLPYTHEVAKSDRGISPYDLLEE